MASISPAASVPLNSLSELKKVFSLVDRDGSGSINASELAILVKQLGGADVSQFELDNLMKLMDFNRDGIISWDEFSSVIQKWLDEEDPNNSPAAAVALSPSQNRKRKEYSDSASPIISRSGLHKRIRHFFLQFKQRPDFNELREKLATAARESDGSEAAADSTQSILADPMWRFYSAADRLACLTSVSSLLAQIHLIASGILSNDPPVALRCCAGLAEILSICEVYHSPESRYEIAELIVSVFERVSEAAVLKRVIDFLSCNELPELQFHAVHTICNFVNGPRISHTPIDSILHPSKLLHKSRCIQLGAAHALVQLLKTTTHSQLKEQVVYCLGCLASHDSEARDLLLDLGVYTALVNAIVDGIDSSLLVKITWVISIFCGSTHSTHPVYERVAVALPKLAYLLSIKPDDRVLLYAFSSLSFLLPGNELEPAMCQSIVNFTGHNSTIVQESALKTIRSLLSVDSSAAPIFIAASMHLAAKELLKSTPPQPQIRCLVLQVLQLLFDDTQLIGSLIDCDLPAILIPIFNSDESSRSRLIVLFRQLTRSAAAEFIHFLLESQLISVISSNLKHFKQYDSLLKDVYSYLGASFNFDFLHDGLATLIAIADRLLSDSELQDSTIQSQLTEKFGLETLDSLKEILLLLYGDAADLMDSWRKVAETRAVAPLEEIVKELLKKIQLIHSRNRTNASALIQKTAEEILALGEDAKRKNSALVERKRKIKTQEVNSMAPIVSRSLSNPGQSSSSSSAFASSGFVHSTVSMNSSMPITFKCFFNGDNRVIEFPSESIGVLTLRELSNRIAIKYDRPLTIQFEDSEGDKITIDSQELLSRALKQIDATNNSIRLYLIPKPFASGNGLSISVGNSNDSVFSYNPSDRMTRFFDSNNASNSLSASSSSNSLFDRFSGSHKFFGNQNQSSNGNGSGNGNSTQYSNHWNSGNFHTNHHSHNNQQNHNGSQPPLLASQNNRHSMMKRLVDITKFSRKDLENLYKQFQRQANNGLLNQTQFAEGLKGIQEDPASIQQLFSAFDNDGDGFVSFPEFATGLSTLHKGTMADRLQMAFHAFDLDGNGFIDRAELFALYKSSLQTRGTYSSDGEISSLVDQTFAEADSNGDGKLDYREFSEACVRHPIIVQAFWSSEW